MCKKFFEKIDSLNIGTYNLKKFALYRMQNFVVSTFFLVQIRNENDYNNYARNSWNFSAVLGAKLVFNAFFAQLESYWLFNFLCIFRFIYLSNEFVYTIVLKIDFFGNKRFRKSTFDRNYVMRFSRVYCFDIFWWIW